MRLSLIWNLTQNQEILEYCHNRQEIPFAGHGLFPDVVDYFSAMPSCFVARRWRHTMSNTSLLFSTQDFSHQIQHVLINFK